MILRRPYAFLIKHFRFIHLILFILFAYIAVKANGILSFFKEYISINGNIEVIASNYTSSFIYISIVLIIALSVVIYLLMRYKNKPRTLYVFTILISIVSLVMFIYLFSNIKELETTVMSGKAIRLLRDISRINFWALCIISIPILVRGLGFDIKKFNFTKDIADLKLEEKDSEEVEVSVDISTNTIKRTGNRLGRELRYYYIENKFIINIILAVVVVILIIMFPFNKFVINRDINEGDGLNTNYFNLKIEDSFISERNRISKNNSYVILIIDVKGKVNNYSLKLDEFVLKGENNDYIPSLKYYNYFKDLGVGYDKEVLDTNEYKKYLLIYNIKNEDKDSNFSLNYLGNGRKIKLSPENLD